MRFVRVPYCYLPDAHVYKLYSYSHLVLRCVHDIHHDIPNTTCMRTRVKPFVQAFMYHASFLRWVFVKATAERLRRGKKCPKKLTDGMIQLRSRPLAEFVPPKDADIAEDIVWLLQAWAAHPLKGGELLPLSYVELANQFYDYTPEQATYERIDQLPGRHRDADAGWYHIQGEAAAQVNHSPLEDRVRSGRDAGG